MDYLQYKDLELQIKCTTLKVLNLIINGLPSISKEVPQADGSVVKSFKPYYKWITFNIYNEANAAYLHSEF